MSANGYEIARAAGLIALLLSLAFGLSRCASAPVTAAQTEINGVIKSGVLEPPHVVTVEDKTAIRAALTHAGEQIAASSAAQARAEKKAASSAAWAATGKTLAAVLAGISVFCVLGLLAVFLRRF